MLFDIDMLCLMLPLSGVLFALSLNIDTTVNEVDTFSALYENNIIEC